MPNERPFHPLAEDYPLMPEGELRLIADDMAENGFDARFPVVWYEGLILDGRNRWLAARLAGVEPDSVQLAPNVDPATFVRRANEHRRHLTQEWLQRRRQERIARAGQARANGDSIRTIAEREGVSIGQVQRDLEVDKLGSTVSPDTVDPKTSTGRDGKIRPATRPTVIEPEEEYPAAEEEEEPEVIAPGHPPEPTPKPVPPPPRHPHSDTLIAWLRAVAGQTFVIRVEQGGVKALLAERDKWDWPDVRTYLLPMLGDLADVISEFRREIEHAAQEQ